MRPGYPAQRSFAVLAAALLVVAACERPSAISADAGPTDLAGADCGLNLKPYRTACLPLLDDCNGERVPIPGGGCKRVGVEACEALNRPGLRGPPDWTCTPVGPPRACLPGWAKDAEGGCRPILPGACPPGAMEVIGSTSCQAVGACGSGSWGKLKVTEQTLYVDATNGSSSGDGSAAKPFSTITAAIAAAPKGGRVAVAAGTYTADLTIDKPLTLEGRCPALVKVVGTSAALLYVDAAAIRVKARGVTLRGLTVSGPGPGIVVEGGLATIETIVVQETGVTGIAVIARGEADLREVLVTGARYASIHATGSKLTLQRVTARDGRAHPTLDYGFGVIVQDDKGVPGRLVARDCVLRETLDTGLFVGSSTALVERTAVLKTRAFPVSNVRGDGVAAWTLTKQTPSSLVLRDVEIADNRRVGLLVSGGSATAERVSIRRTRAQSSDKSLGAGILVQGDLEQPGEISLREVLVSGNVGWNVLLLGSKAVVERSIISDVEEHPLRRYGAGVQVEPLDGRPGDLTLRDALISGNRGFGLVLLGATARVERTLVKESQPTTSGSLGFGVAAMMSAKAASSLTLSDSVVSDCRTVGIDVEGSTASIERSIVRRTGWQSSDGRYGVGINAVALDGRPSTLTLLDTLVSDNNYAGVLGGESTGKLQRVDVRNTRSHQAQFGVGIAWSGGAAKLAVSDSSVVGNIGKGVVVQGAGLEIVRSAIRKTVSASGKKWGDGVEINAGGVGATAANVLISDVLVERSSRVGLLVFSRRGRMKRSVVRGGALSVVIDGATFALEPSNVFEENLDNRPKVAFGLGSTPQLKVPPPPKLKPSPQPKAP